MEHSKNVYCIRQHIVKNQIIALDNPPRVVTEFWLAIAK
jgi:hypothetical protein